MTTEPLYLLRPGDKVESKAITNSTSAELTLRQTVMEYPFDVVSAPPMKRLPDDWLSKGQTPTMVVPKLITFRVKRYIGRDGTPKVEVSAVDIHGYRVLKSGAVSDAIRMDIRLGYKREEWPEWILNLVSQFEDGTLS